MTRAWYSTAAVALLVVLAGCAGGIGGAPATTTDRTTTAPDDADAGSGAATVQFYVSDERNDIDDFRSLEVTITEVGFQRADDGETDDGDADDEENSDTTTTTANGTTTANRTTTTANQTTTTTTANGTTTTEVPDDSDGADEEEADEGDGDWVTVDIEDRTVDLTELKGANATLLANVTIPEGTYTKVFIAVSDTNGTLTNGETTNVKLPSERLQLTKRFTAGANETVEFVYDVTAVKAGKSGKYILKPVVSQSGTDVPIEEVGDRAGARGPPENRGDDDRDDADGADDSDREERRQDDDTELDVAVEGDVAPDETVTLTVTRNGSAVANATVSVNGEAAGTTAQDGTFTFTVPDAEELEVEVASQDGEAELEYEFETDDESEQGDDRGSERGQGNGR